MRGKFLTILTAAAFAAAVPISFAVAEQQPAAQAQPKGDSDQPIKDAFLKGRIVSSLAMNDTVSAFDVDVKVENGVAFLGGTVDTAVERDVAIEVARGIDDVRDVKSTITVKPGTRDARAQEESRSIGEVASDVSTTTAIKGKLLANQNTSGLGINVTTEKGVVTLSGTVASRAERDLAEQIAENQNGVRDVRNELTVGTEKEGKDEPSS